NRDIPIAHGFRYFWMTQAGNAEINAEIREMLLGHKIGLASAYYRPTVDKMYQEYEKLIDDLTIDPSQRLQKKLETVQQESNQIDRLATDMQKIKESMRRFDEERLPEIVQAMLEGKARMQWSHDGKVEEVWKANKKGQLTKRQVK